MNQDNTDQTALETFLKQKFKSDEWLSYQNKNNGVDSKFYVNKDFHQEHKENLRKLRFNKRNPTKGPTYYENISVSGENPAPLSFSSPCDHIYQSSLPNTATYTYQGLGSRVYNCNFTNDGRNLLVTSQRGTSFFTFSDDNKVELSKVVPCNNVNWAITDSDVSSNNKFMIHSTLSPYIHVFDLEKSKYSGQITLTNTEQPNSDLNDFIMFFSLRVYSLKLSGDNRQIIAGCGRTIGGAPVQVFDLEKNKVTHSIVAHSDDINTITYVNKQEPSVFISGSDDGVCKLWDTRTTQNNKPVGIFYGHVSGLTCVTSKEDNRYFITNCKDQSIKLWDLRKLTTEKMNYPFLKYDYRYEILGPEHIEEIKRSQKKVDQSLMTFWGHQVHSTLIRCHFSPVFGTAQRYIYTGSYDGRVYIYDTISGQNIACLEPPNDDVSVLNCPVIRDCAWHPYSQTLVSTSFFGEIHKWEHLDIRNAEKISKEPEECPNDDSNEELILEEDKVESPPEKYATMNPWDCPEDDDD